MALKRFQQRVGEVAEAAIQSSQRISEETLQTALSLIIKNNGKLFAVGIGKSGNIAEKVAATLSSTGTPTIFLHAAEAFHGGLGVMGEGDLALMFSGSGETQEVVDLIPHLKERSIPIISFCGNIKSTLAKESEAVFDCSVSKEICPHNLAPTTSTSVSLIIADALAMALMDEKGIGENEFAKNHPSGNLGKRLTLKVSDLMRSPAPCVGEKQKTLEVLTAISEGGAGAVCVLSKEGGLTGFITDGDLRRFFEAHKEESLFKNANDIGSLKPTTVGAETLAIDVLRTMENKEKLISVAPVSDVSGKIVGIIRLHDILQSGLF